jgi:hypothetical protein
VRSFLAIVAGVLLVPVATAARGLVFTANAGEAVHGSIDAGGTPFAADATTRNSTGIVYRTRTAPRDAGRWISFGSPKGGMVPFTIHVPRGAEPGEHFAGIVTPHGVVGVEVDVVGPRAAGFVLGGASADRRRLYLRVTNTGNIAARPHGIVSIEHRNGAVLAGIGFRMATFLPHTSIDYPLALRTRLGPGNYVANVKLTYSGPDAGGVQSSSAAPEFIVSDGPRRAAPAPPSQGVQPQPESAHGGSAWPWVAGAAATLLAAAAVAGVVILWRRRPVPVTVRPLYAPASMVEPCEGHHYWQVDWDSARPDASGDVSYVHRCRRCGFEVRAADIGEAAAKASS